MIKILGRNVEAVESSAEKTNPNDSDTNNPTSSDKTSTGVVAKKRKQNLRQQIDVGFS